MNEASLRCTTVASILAFASTAKLLAVYHHEAWGLAQQVHLVVAVGELTIAIGLIVRPKAWWVLGACAYVGLAVYATALAVGGRPSCDCFGAILFVSPHILVMTDLICASLLLSFGVQSLASFNMRAIWQPTVICGTACMAAFAASSLIQNVPAWNS